MQSLGPRPYPGEDTATTRDSDDYLEKNGLGTRETASPGELSPTGSVNELLKQVATDNNREFPAVSYSRRQEAR